MNLFAVIFMCILICLVPAYFIYIILDLYDVSEKFLRTYAVVLSAVCILELLVLGCGSVICMFI